MTLARRVALATGVQVAGKVLALTFSLVSVKLTTTYLGVDGFGAYGIVVAGSSLAFALADLGIPMLLARELAKDPARADELGARLLFLRLVTCAAVFALVACIVPFLPYTATVKQGLLIATAGMLVGVVSLFPMPFFQVHMRLELAALTEVFTRAVALAALAIVVALDLGFLPLVATIALAWSSNLVFAFALSRRFWRVGVRVDVRQTWALLAAALPIALVGVLGLLHFKVDVLLLSFLKPEADVGIYTLGYSVFEQALVLQGLFLAVVFPILTRFVHVRDAVASADVIDKSFRFLVVLGLLVACLLFTLADPLVAVLSSGEFEESVGTLRILSFAILPLFAAAIFSSLLVSLADLRYLAVVSVVGIVVNVVLNLIVIPSYSYDGAAATTVFSEALGFAMVYAVAYRRTRARVAWPAAVRLAALTAVVLGAGLLALVLPWWVAAPLAAAACGLGALVLGAVSREEVRLVLGRQGWDAAATADMAGDSPHSAAVDTAGDSP